MNPSFYPIIFMWIIIFIIIRKQRALIIGKVISKKKKGGNAQMKELAERFIGKECVIYSFDSNHQYTGVIKEVTNGAVLIEKNGQLEALNLEFVIRIREYPKNKKGKDKSVIVD